mgnify:CR=1 FL=1
MSRRGCCNRLDGLLVVLYPCPEVPGCTFRGGASYRVLLAGLKTPGLAWAGPPHACPLSGWLLWGKEGWSVVQAQPSSPASPASLACRSKVTLAPGTPVSPVKHNQAQSIPSQPVRPSLALTLTLSCLCFLSFTFCVLHRSPKNTNSPIRGDLPFRCPLGLTVPSSGPGASPINHQPHP